MFVVEGVPEGAEGLLPARRRDVKAAAGLQVAPSGEDVDVSASAVLAVQHGSPGISVGFQSRPGRLFEGVQDRLDLLVGGSVLRCPGDHSGRVPVLERQRIGHGGHHVRVPAQHLDALAQLPGRVPLPEEVAGRCPGRAGSAREELNQHRRPGSRSERASRANAR